MLRPLLIIALSIAGAHLADAPAWRLLHSGDAAAHDWHRLLRVCGFLPTWLAIGAALALVDRAWRRAGPLVLSAALSGLAAELLKLIVRRERPGAAGEYSFRAFSDDPLSTAALGMPSSHAAVAFGGAWMLARLHPRLAPVPLLLAAGCGLTRVIDRAHFFSDVIAAAGVAWMLAWWLDQRIGSRP